MNIISLDNKERLNNFVSSQKRSQFLQSWQWGEFSRAVSGGVWRLGIEDDGRLIATMTIIKKELPMNKSYFFCPRGPIVSDKISGDNQKVEEVLKMFFLEAQKIASAEGAMFFRFEPIFGIDGLGIILEKTLDIEPKKTAILDLAKTEKEILDSMHQKTRYNIRLAEKKGVGFVIAGVERFGDFWKLMDETGDRDDFRPHGSYYYEAMLKADPEFIKLLLVEYDNKVLAANIVSFFGDTVTYMHGASSSEDRSVMAPFLLQWETIKLAKSKNYKYYDFFGIDEERWPGVTRFKRGFSGEEVEYPGTFDWAFDAGWYSVYKMIRKIRRTF